MGVFEQQVKSVMEIVKAATLEKRLIPGASKSKFEKRIEAITSSLVAHGVIAFVVQTSSPLLHRKIVCGA
tara:strand:+ start:860667 stop:860876 length:210 start_codon:yes stop_codon:yes gene_type:complete